MRSGRTLLFVGVVLAGVAVAVAVARTRNPPTPKAAEVEPAPAAPPRAPQDTPPLPPAAPAPSPSPRNDEQSRMMAIRGKVTQSPLEALALIEEAEKEYPNGALTEARAAAKVDALVHAGRIGAARDAAEDYLRRFPNGESAQHIEMLTGVHPRPPAPDQR